MKSWLATFLGALVGCTGSAGGGSDSGAGGDEPFVQPGLDDPTARMWTRAGEWYPDDPDELDREIAGMMRAVEASPRSARAILTPHAGLRFSGPMAAEAWARVSVPDRIIILAPNHWMDGVEVALWTDGPWLVPGHALGIDADLTARLQELEPSLERDREAFIHHEVEMNLPFLQYVNPDVEMVVAAWRDNQDWDFRDFTLEEVQAAGLAVAQLIEEAEADGEEVLLLMTTDLVHYVSLEQAEEEDPILMDHITALDVEGLYEAVQEQGLSICGEVPTAIGMEALRALGYSRFDFSKRTTSYDVSGDETRVVGYPAGAVWR